MTPQNDKNEQDLIPPITRAMLLNVQFLTQQIYGVAGQAMEENNEKKRDKLINRMINHCDELEPLYSTNWH